MCIEQIPRKVSIYEPVANAYMSKNFKQFQRPNSVHIPLKTPIVTGSATLLSGGSEDKPAENLARNPIRSEFRTCFYFFFVQEVPKTLRFYFFAACAPPLMKVSRFTSNQIGSSGEGGGGSEEPVPESRRMRVSGGYGSDLRFQ